MPIIDGTTYHADTDERVIRVLENARYSGLRLRIHYGDVTTGRAWGNVEIGRIGRSTGQIKIPLCIHNVRSTGGPGLLEHCIIKIECANKKDGGVLYQVTPSQ